MTGLNTLIGRNVKLYFKDKGMFLTSLITPVILLVLYATFLRNVYVDSFQSALRAAGAGVPEALINGFVGGQLVSSLLAVSCVTVAFCSNLLMVQDKSSGARHDLTIAPVKPAVLALGYYLASLISALVIALIAVAMCLVYLGFTGWYLSAGDVAGLIGGVVLLVLFGTALSSCIVFPLSTQGQASAVGTIVSSGYGFVCGAYMPISSFSAGLQRVMSFLPGTYGTGILRNCAMEGSFAEMRRLGFPEEVVQSIRDSVDCNVYFYGTRVGLPVMYLILAGSILALIGLYVLLNSRTKKGA